MMNLYCFKNKVENAADHIFTEYVPKYLKCFTRNYLNMLQPLKPCTWWTADILNQGSKFYSIETLVYDYG